MTVVVVRPLQHRTTYNAHVINSRWYHRTTWIISSMIVIMKILFKFGTDWESPTFASSFILACSCRKDEQWQQRHLTNLSPAYKSNIASFNRISIHISWFRVLPSGEQQLMCNVRIPECIEHCSRASFILRIIIITKSGLFWSHARKPVTSSW